ncbi:Gfo/Idh/MocA family protein [Bacillus infantis]|uniref:Gfo/Idh/MocA family protein n=1 Tax=Bacillus infantis TaxID=324767 RepID=UPI003CF7FAA7
MASLNIGMIGLDTSHAAIFTRLLNDPSDPFHVGGGEVVIASPVGSQDFDLSASRIEGITKEVAAYDVEIVKSIEEVAEKCDAILVESVDGRAHLEQVRRLAPFHKPLFIDKPFCLSAADASRMIEIAEQNQAPIMSASALRFADALQKSLAALEKSKITGADCFGPMEMAETQPGYFWYGIHTIEMLYAILGRGVHQVTAVSNRDHDLIAAQWENGRIGTVRGNRKGNYSFGAVIHHEQGSEYILVDTSEKPFYASLLEHIMYFFSTGKTAVPMEETLDIIRFIEAANKSRKTGMRVFL